MDLGQITPIQRKVEITLPSGQPTGVFVTLVGPDDPKLKKLRESISNKVAAQQAKGKALKSDEMKQNRFLILFNAIISWDWTGDATLDGAKPELTQKNAFEIFDRLPWFADKLDEYFSETESFFDQPQPND